MAPRREHSRDELSELVLAGARRIAEREGLAGLTARALAREIGYSPGTLYNLFADLDDIVLQLNGQTLDELHAVLRRAPTGPDPETALLELGRAYIGFIRAHPRLWSVLFEHNPPAGRELPEAQRERIGRLLALVTAALTPLFAPDERRQLEHSARVLWSATQGISVLAGAGKLVQAESVTGLLRDLIGYYVAGLSAAKTHPDFEAP